MLSVLKNRTYRHLFAAQVIALVGTGLMTVALGLLAYDLAGANAGAVLGTALAIKMLAYVGVAPVAQAFADRLPRRSLLVALDLVRASVALCLPFVSEIWQIYLLIRLAGGVRRLHADLSSHYPGHPSRRRRVHESTVAFPAGLRFGKPDFPMLAAALLTVISFHNLFAGTVLGFLVSAALVVSVRLPTTVPGPRRGIWDRTTRARAFTSPRRAFGVCWRSASRWQQRVNGDREHGGHREGTLRPGRIRGSVGAGGLRRRVDGCGLRAASPARQDC